MADGVPTYVVRNDHSGGKLVLHQARLLLWIADCTNRDDGISVNFRYSSANDRWVGEGGANCKRR